MSILNNLNQPYVDKINARRQKNNADREKAEMFFDKIQNAEIRFRLNTLAFAAFLLLFIIVGGFLTVFSIWATVAWSDLTMLLPLFFIGIPMTVASSAMLIKDRKTGKAFTIKLFKDTSGGIHAFCFSKHKIQYTNVAAKESLLFFCKPKGIYKCKKTKAYDDELTFCRLPARACNFNFFEKDGAEMIKYDDDTVSGDDVINRITIRIVNDEIVQIKMRGNLNRKTYDFLYRNAPDFSITLPRKFSELHDLINENKLLSYVEFDQ